MKRWIFFAVIGVAAAGLCELRVNPLFTSHMVLQRNQPTAVYGTADVGESVAVEFGGQVKIGVADSSKHWKVFLDPMPASSKPGRLRVSSSGSQVSFSDVLVGDVWLCAGQSNMATLMKNYPTLKDEIPSMTNRMIRLFKSKHEGFGASEPLDEVVADAAFDHSWQPMAPEFAENFSATACFFGKVLQSRTGVPVGLLYANRGGTQVNMWLPLKVMEKKPEVYGRFLDKNWSEWTPHPQGNPEAIRAPSYLYNGTIHPLTKFTIRGVIWYQGESDAMFAMAYSDMIKDLISSWREAWGYEFPFLCVQLAPYGAVAWDNSGESWAWQREAQMAAQELPKTEMAVITDAGEYKDIHPQNKPVVGERLARLAASLDDPAIAARSPEQKSVFFEKEKAVITFSNVADGLETRRVAMNLNGCLPPGEDPYVLAVSADRLSGFEICGRDQCFKKAQAVVTGKDSVCVWSDEVSAPVAVRYGWANFPLCNLYNSEGLPASPFRTDSFEMPDFYALPDFAESDFKIEDPKPLTLDESDESLSGWRKSAPELQAEYSNGWMGIYLPIGKNESLLSTDEVRPGSHFHLQTDLKVLSPRVWGGVVFHYRSSDDYYVFRFCSGTDQAQFIHYIRKSPRVLQSFKASKPFAVDTIYRLEVSARPNDSFGDGAYLFKVTEPATKDELLHKGKIDFGGGMSGGSAGCYIGTPSPNTLLMCRRVRVTVEKMTD